MIEISKLIRKLKWALLPSPKAEIMSEPCVKEMLFTKALSFSIPLCNWSCAVHRVLLVYFFISMKSSPVVWPNTIVFQLLEHTLIFLRNSFKIQFSNEYVLSGLDGAAKQQYDHYRTLQRTKPSISSPRGKTKPHILTTFHIFSLLMNAQSNWCNL